MFIIYVNELIYYCHIMVLIKVKEAQSILNHDVNIEAGNISTKNVLYIYI